MDENRCLGSFYGSSDPISGAEDLNCVDLYAGAGGFSLAALNLGLSVKAAIEWDSHACETYEWNLVRDGEPRLYCGDINDLDPNRISLEVFGNRHQCDIILGGPPCQGFSAHRINGAGVGDPRNNLIHRYFDFVRAFGAKIFLMENVPGMLWPRHQPFVESFYNEAEKAGYDVLKPVIFDAADYGVPQRRKRVFILGSLKGERLDLTWPPPITFGDVKPRNGHRVLQSRRTANDVFATALPMPDENMRHMNHGPDLIEVFKSTPPDGGSRRDSNRVLPCHKGHNGHKDVYGRINPLEPGPTMTTACINPSKGRFVHPTENHGITVRQAARFQTFPDDFIFKGGLISAGNQIGNAVPILLGEALLRVITMSLLSKQ